MKKLFKITLIVVLVLLCSIFLLNKFFFRTDLDQEPEITNLKESKFEFFSSKPFYFKVNNSLYYSADGRLNYSGKPILEGEVEEAYISPNSKYALIYFDKALKLIDSTGKEIFKIEDCSPLITVEVDRKSGRFNSSAIQWGKNSDYFLIAQDRVWDKNFSKKNKTSIYKYSILDNSFNPLIEFDEELQGDFVLSSNEKYIYYEYSTAKGDLAFKKVDVFSKKVISEHFQNDSLKLTDITTDSVFINYNKFKAQFQGNSFDLQSIIMTARKGDVGLFYKDNDTIVRLLSGTSGFGAFKGNTFDYFSSGFYLPGNRYFIANISAKNFSGQLVIDTKTFQIMKLEKKTEFYFNVNSNDCNDFVFRYEIGPNIKFATSVSLEIEGLVDISNNRPYRSSDLTFFMEKINKEDNIIFPEQYEIVEENDSLDGKTRLHNACIKLSHQDIQKFIKENKLLPLDTVKSRAFSLIERPKFSNSFYIKTQNRVEVCADTMLNKLYISKYY